MLIQQDKNLFRKVFRLIFVISFLYLVGDVFYRWDGFSYHGSFSEFLPSLALIIILWSFFAVFISVLTWMFLWMIERLFHYIGWKIKADHVLLFSAIVIILGVITWVSKRYFVHYGTNLQVKLLVFLCVAFISVLFAWRFRNHAMKWIEFCQVRIVPLVYLFTICVILSIPLLSYHLLIEKNDQAALHEVIHSDSSMQPNILFVTFDAMTARHMSLYGYHIPTTPFLSEWAKTATVFTAAKAESNYTRATVTSLMTGKRVWSHQMYHPDQRTIPVNIETENIALLLKKNGYFNISLMTTLESRAGSVFKHFDVYPSWTELESPATLSEYINNKLFKLFGDRIVLYDWFVKEDFVVSKLLDKVVIGSPESSKRPSIAFNKFLEILDSGAPTPYFAWIHLFPPHFAYLPPEPYLGMFNPSPDLRTINSYLELRDNRGNISFIDNEKLAILTDRYNEDIRYCDDQFRMFIEKFEAKNRLKNTVVIFSSDHGEGFDHGAYLHGGPHVFESMMHIPLIIKEYGREKGRVSSELVEQIDIPATILDLADIPEPSWMEGRSLVPLLRDHGVSSKPILSMNLERNPTRGHKITNGTIAVWENDLKLIHYLDNNKSLLFNLKTDPDELINLFDKEHEAGHRLLKIIKDNIHRANENISN